VAGLKIIVDGPLALVYVEHVLNLIKLLIIVTQALNIAATTLCCHTCPDGFHGCWPAKPDSECESYLQCPYGAHQADENDSESWVCNAPPRPNS